MSTSLISLYHHSLELATAELNAAITAEAHNNNFLGQTTETWFSRALREEEFASKCWRLHCENIKEANIQ